jgi:uncharacterized protein YjlB
MALLEDVKKIAEKVTGFARPGAQDLRALVRARKAHAFRFRDDGVTPNHPRWPLVLYRGAVQLPDRYDPAAVFEDLFAGNGWDDAWRNGIYDYLHYHSGKHEVLGIARGTATVQFGGRRGRKLKLKAGDVAVLPAGTGHQCLAASRDLLVVGAYPPIGVFDECRPSSADGERTRRSIRKTGRPRKDPVYGARGPLTRAWPARR